MQRYKVLDTISLHTGILDLTEAQATPRKDALISLGEGLYEIIKPVEFKAGEIIGYDGDINRDLTEKLLPAEEAPVAEKPAKIRKKADVVH